MTGLVLIGLIVAVLAWLTMRAGNRQFWKAAAAMPDEAYEWFMTESCWVVQDPASGPTAKPELRSAYTGPFFLWVPKLGGRRVIIYGLHDQIEASQARFLEQHGYPVHRFSSPPASAVALLYPTAAVIYLAQSTPAPLIVVAGYGLAQLGYTLLAAGLLVGTFRVFGLRRRWQVLLAGALALTVGTMLSNVVA
ncbi:MAG: hypothetical protein ACHQ7N_01075 [Candidatus Methylomirabilales bacterium]